MPFSVDTFLLKSFVAIAETGQFTAAANMVGRTQAAISLQVKKLEERLGCQLLERGTRHVALTNEGDIFLAYARRMLELQNEMVSQLKEPDIAGEIRFGTPEDFATHYLPDVLARFRHQHPRVQLCVECDLTLNLISGFERGMFDVILVKRDPQRVSGGTRVWREPLVWAASPQFNPGTSFPLVLSPQPCIYRARALDALDRAKIPWHLTYTSPSLAGTIAAVQASLGVTVLPANMLPQNIHPVGNKFDLPQLADAEMALLKQSGLSKVGKLFVDYIIHSLEQS